jgi:hypothetical protein
MRRGRECNNEIVAAGCPESAEEAKSLGTPP